MYNPFLRVTLTPNFKEGHLIQWKIDPVFAESEPYQYIVEVSQTANFSSIDYTLPPTDQFVSIDSTNTKQSIYVDLYYRVKLRTADGNIYYSRTILFGADIEPRRQYRMASEIIRKELLRMRKFTGMPGYLLKRKSFGQVRQDAVDEITGVPITNNTSDFGTGLDGGYFAPMAIIFSYEDDDQDRKLSPDGMGTVETYTAQLRMIGFPAIDTHDIIVDPVADARYIVKTVKTETFPSTSIAIIQIIAAAQIPVTDPVYQIPVT